MPLGLIVLFALVGIVLFGFAQRMLDRMRLTDAQAIIVLGLIIVGSMFDLPVSRGRTTVTLNVGGVIVPALLAVYVLIRAGTAWERTRAILASVITAGIVFSVSRLTDFGPHGGTPMILDSLWLFAIVGGVVAYIFGRSRRGAFVAGVLGLMLFQLSDLLISTGATTGGTVALGGGGFFDAIVLAGVISVGLAELVGETRERLQGGPDPDRPPELRRALTNSPEIEGRGESDHDE